MTDRERVAQGCRILDEARPGWRVAINPDTLDIGDPFQCILGQLYGTFERGLEALDLSSRWAAEAGFANDPGVNDDEALTTAWLEVEGIR